MNPLPEIRSVSVAAKSPGLRPEAVDVVVIVPTFRRPKQILDTLATLKAQTDDAPLRHHPDRERCRGPRGRRRRRHRLFADWHAMTGMVIVAHERGNCSAYNAGLQTALHAVSAFPPSGDHRRRRGGRPRLAGDGCARPPKRFGADIVGGPQVPVFADPSHERLAQPPGVCAAPTAQSGLVPALYSSGNLLIGRQVLAAMPAPFLDTKFNFMGGGDSDFLSRAAVRGFTLAWCAEAIVRETVPARRVEADWIRARVAAQRRDLDAGAEEASWPARRSAASGGAEEPGAAGRFAVPGSRGAGCAPVRCRSGSIRSMSAPGRVLAEFGYANEQYRQPEKN